MLSASEKLTVLGSYIGQQVVIRNLHDGRPQQIGWLIGIKDKAILVDIAGTSRWIPMCDEIRLCEVKLLLKPLKKLTSAIIETANSLPVQSFIVPFYQQLGFDMPVFIAPDHPCNCKYVSEIGLAVYDFTDEDEIAAETVERLVAVH